MKRIFTLLLILFSYSVSNAATDSSVNCNWKSKVNDFNVWSNCDSSRTNTYLIGRFILNKNYTCKKGKVWKWVINNSNSVYSQNLYYKLSKNGTYNVCLYLYDSCNRCDTVICKSVTITCLPGCNWKSKVNDFNVWTNCDSNRTNTYLIGRFILNKNYTCSKGKVWKWTMNNTVVSSSQNLYYKISKNGSYTVCLYLYDSCNKCDTTICKTITVSCISGCEWKSKINDFNVWTNCDSSRKQTYLIARFLYNKNYTCTKGKRWKWMVNNSAYSYSQNLYYPISQNGSYTVCLYLYDSCSKCDTTYCKTIQVSCLGKCKLPKGWGQSNSCASYTFEGFKVEDGNTMYLNPCHKYFWDFGDKTTGSGRVAQHTYTKNGTYTVCMRVKDTCLNCDTSICKTITITCLKSCNWKSKVNDFNVWTNCDSNRTQKYLIGRFILNKNYTCTKGKRWKWMVNNSVVSYSPNLYYPVSKNGSYTVCLWLYDSCNNCDTSYCKTVQVNCLSGCNWKSKVNDFNVWTNCDSTRKQTYLIGRFILNKNYTCKKGKKWKWSVNNAVVSTSPNLYYPISQNGTYTVCLWLYDSCNNCDTSYCKTVQVNCISKCNWKNRVNDFLVKPICDSSGKTAGIYGKFTVNKNYTCKQKLYRKWIINNTVAGYGETVSYKVTKNGMYNVCVVVYDSCMRCDTSFCRIVQVNCKYLGLEENNTTLKPNVYPNPFNTEFTITGLESENSEFSCVLFDLQGKQVPLKHLSAYRFDTAELPSGIYILELTQGTSIYHLRLIKE